MSNNPYEIPPMPERDVDGGDDLPSYNDLAVQNGPNSRFGRWREWIEKRAAERYADVTPEDFTQRRARGWGEGTKRNPQDELGPDQLNPPSPPGGSAHAVRLHLQTSFSMSSAGETLRASPVSETATVQVPQVSVGESMPPSHLEVHQFGSRFLPHAKSTIRCLLPLLGDRVLLIGHDNGLSVMDMYPKEWNDQGLAQKGPNDAEARPIWVGEGVFQMNIIESESTGEGIPQGVVLALVGPDNSSQENPRSLRMYNLASLISLAKYFLAQPPGHRPLDLGSNHSTYSKPTQTTPKKHRKAQSLAKGFKNLAVETPSGSIYGRGDASYTQLASVIDSPSPVVTSPLGSFNESTTTLDSWDMVTDELPLRWATDFTPLATPGSKLTNTSVLTYAMYRDEHQRSRGGVCLAIAVKCNILLYETPKGERAFRFVKEFYTPITARSLTFVHQAVQDPMSRSPSDMSHSRHNFSTPTPRHPKRFSIGAPTSSHPHYPPQLSLFVVFEKKAGLIRIADSAVSEVDLFDENVGQHALLGPLASSVGSLGKKNRSSWDSRGFLRESKVTWIPPVRITVSGQTNESWTSPTQNMYLLTRGKHSHILPYPLPAHLPAIPPFRTFSWSSVPNHISARICRSQEGLSTAFLQVIAFGDEGVEVQEIPLSSITVNTSKGKSRAAEPVKAMIDLGGDTGYLCTGGLWHIDPSRPDFLRSDSMMSTDSVLEDISSCDIPHKVRDQEGIYGWVRKGAEDWRVFWVGGTGDHSDIANHEQL